MNRSARALKIASRMELTSLAVLLLNLALGNAQQVAAIAGPIHGCLYLLVIILTARDPRTTPKAAALAVVPGVGGLLARRRLDASTGPAVPSPHLETSRQNS